MTAANFKLVPVEPTEDMVIAGFESVPDPVFAPEHWDEYEHMSGCQKAAMRARLCYAAMLAAAPASGGLSFDAAWDGVDWDTWRMRPIIDLVRHLHTLTATSTAAAAPEVPLKGCAKCYGSGGKAKSPCVVCQGSGKVPA